MTQTRHRTDLQLEHAIFDELRWTPSVKSARIRVAVVDGTATLSGEVATYPETMLAAKAALRVLVAVASPSDLGDLNIGGREFAPEEEGALPGLSVLDPLRCEAEIFL